MVHAVCTNAQRSRAGGLSDDDSRLTSSSDSQSLSTKLLAIILSHYGYSRLSRGDSGEHRAAIRSAGCCRKLCTCLCLDQQRAASRKDQDQIFWYAWVIDVNAKIHFILFKQEADEQIIRWLLNVVNSQRRNKACDFERFQYNLGWRTSKHTQHISLQVVKMNTSIWLPKSDVIYELSHELKFFLRSPRRRVIIVSTHDICEYHYYVISNCSLYYNMKKSHMLPSAVIPRPRVIDCQNAGFTRLMKHVRKSYLSAAGRIRTIWNAYRPQHLFSALII